MVGNDVVDLMDPDSDPSTLSARFDERVMSRAEREQIARAVDEPSERWCLWAAKEAAYKLARRCNAKLIFSPVRFGVELDLAEPGRTERRGRVHHDGLVQEVRVWCDHESVHAVAAHPSSSHYDVSVVHGVLRLPEGDAELESPDGPGRVVRRLARLEIARALDAATETIEIRREQRMPVVYRDGRPADVHLSLSHHGALVAWAFRVDDSHRRQRLAS